MNIFQITLITTTFLCSMVAGFLLAFAIVVMPGIKKLSDQTFLRTFQAIDKVIQNRQPLFMLIWIGSIITLIIAVVLSIQEIEGIRLTLLIIALLLFLFGVHLPTVIINIPLNNKLQSLEIDTINDISWKSERDKFELKWNRWNRVRTIISCLTSLLLLIIVFSL